MDERGACAKEMGRKWKREKIKTGGKGPRSNKSQNENTFITSGTAA